MNNNTINIKGNIISPTYKAVVLFARFCGDVCQYNNYNYYSFAKTCSCDSAYVKMVALLYICIFLFYGNELNI